MKQCEICEKTIPKEELGYCVTEDGSELCINCADNPKVHEIGDAHHFLNQVVKCVNEQGGVYEKTPLINSIEYFIKTGYIL